MQSPVFWQWCRMTLRCLCWAATGAFCGAMWFFSTLVVWQVVQMLWTGGNSGGTTTIMFTFNDRAARWSGAVEVLTMMAAGFYLSFSSDAAAKFSRILRVALWAASVCAFVGVLSGFILGGLLPALPIAALRWSFTPYVLTSAFGSTGLAFVAASCGFWTGSALGWVIGVFYPAKVEELSALLKPPSPIRESP